MKKIVIVILKIIATIILSVMIIAGLIAFFPLAGKSNNVLLDVIIPMTCYTTFCFAGLCAMWKPLRAWAAF